MTLAISVRHAADLCIALAQFLTPPADPEIKTDE